MWFQLTIEYCPNEDVEGLSEELLELGALSVMYTDKNDNPVLEPEPGTMPLWPEVIINTLYNEKEQALQIKEYLEKKKPQLQLSLACIPDKDWERAWMDDFKPQLFGQRLWICPSWHTPPEPAAVNLMLDPGLAFGTGNHPTTALCLTWLEQAPLQDCRIIDYGCGSGILSLAAAKLGAQHVYAVDIDEQALQATVSNAERNKCREQLTIKAPDCLTETVDILIANILLSPLLNLQERFLELTKPNSLLVVSGLLNEQEALLIDAYQEFFRIKERKQLDGWSLLVFERS